MGKMRCANCRRKVDSGFDYCPSCGCKLDHSAEPSRSSGGGMAAIVVVSLMIIAVATAATVWLVHQKDIADRVELEHKHQADSLKTAEIARQRYARQREDSLAAVREAQEQRRQFERSLFTLDDLITRNPDGSMELKSRSQLQLRLRQLGYSTIHQEADGRCVVMGLNAEVRQGKIAGLSPWFSALGVWPSRLEMVFSTPDDASAFFDSSRLSGFNRSSDMANAAICATTPTLRLVKIDDCRLELIDTAQ